MAVCLWRIMRRKRSTGSLRFFNQSLPFVFRSLAQSLNHRCVCGLFDQYIYGRIENPGNGRAEYTSEELNQLPAKDDLDLGRVSRELSFYSLLHRKDVSEVSRSYFPVPFLVIKRAASYAIAMQLLDGKKQNNQSSNRIDIIIYI